MILTKKTNPPPVVHTRCLLWFVLLLQCWRTDICWCFFLVVVKIKLTLYSKFNSVLFKTQYGAYKVQFIDSFSIELNKPNGLIKKTIIKLFLKLQLSLNLQLTGHLLIETQFLLVLPYVFFQHILMQTNLISNSFQSKDCF